MKFWFVLVTAALVASAGSYVHHRTLRDAHAQEAAAMTAARAGGLDADGARATHRR